MAGGLALVRVEEATLAEGVLYTAFAARVQTVNVFPIRSAGSLKSDG